MSIYKKMGRQKEQGKGSKKDHTFGANKQRSAKRHSFSSLNLFSLKKEDSPRSKRAAHEVKEILASLFERQDLPLIYDLEGNLVHFPRNLTIVDVKMSKDLQECTVFLSSFDHREDIQPYFDLAAGVVRKEFAKQSPFRYVPNFHFKLDESLIAAEKIDRLIDSLSHS